MRQEIKRPAARALLLIGILGLMSALTSAQIEPPNSNLNLMCGNKDYYNTAIYGCTPCG